MYNRLLSIKPQLVFISEDIKLKFLLLNSVFNISLTSENRQEHKPIIRYPSLPLKRTLQCMIIICIDLRSHLLQPPTPGLSFKSNYSPQSYRLYAACLCFRLSFRTKQHLASSLTSCTENTSLLNDTKNIIMKKYQTDPNWKHSTK